MKLTNYRGSSSPNPRDMTRRTFGRLIAGRYGSGIVIGSQPFNLPSLCRLLSPILTGPHCRLYVTLYRLPIHSYVFNRMREIMLKDLKTSAVKLCSVAKPALLSFRSSFSVSPSKMLSPLSDLLASTGSHHLPPLHIFPTNSKGPTRSLCRK